MEEWKDILGLEGRYQVSDLSRVRSLSWEQPHSSGGTSFVKKERVRKFKQPKTNRYIQLGMVTEDGIVMIYHHRLVALAWIPNPENKPFINHKNGIKWDNRIENLEWCTKSENAKHSFATGLQSNKGEKSPMHKLTEKEVLSIRARYAAGESSWKIFKSLDMSYTNVKDIIAKRTWGHI